MYLKLSYDLLETTPMPLGLPPVQIRPGNSIDRGGVSNWFVVELCNHSGTHVDAPWHFNPNGKTISEIPVSDFFFDHPLVLDIPKKDSGLVLDSDLQPHDRSLGNCDLVLIRTGFSKYRFEERQRYITKNPGLSIAAARYLQRFDSLRAIGLDSISMAAHEHLEQGLEAHRILFSRRELPRLLIEDVNLAFDLAKLKRVVVLPLFFHALDGGPCTIAAEVSED